MLLPLLFCPRDKQVSYTYIELFLGQYDQEIDRLRQSEKGPAAADFVPGIIKICIGLLFVLGIN